jgi:hypothetical protein
VTNKVLKLDFYVHSWSPFDRSGEYELAKAAAAAAAAAALVVAWLKEERARFVGVFSVFGGYIPVCTVGAPPCFQLELRNLLLKRVKPLKIS